MSNKTDAPRILAFDIETTPNRGWAYGKWQTNMIRIDEYSSLMSFSYQWLGEKKIHHYSLGGFDYNEEALAMKLHDLFDEADAVLAHNAYGFDVKVMKGIWAKYRIAPPAPYKVIDTLRIARGQFKFPGGNSLNEVCMFLGVGRKSETGIGELWHKCFVDDDPKAWKLLRKYNDMDVKLLVDVYKIMLPYITNHPNLTHLFQARGQCPKCLSDKLEARGFNHKAAGKVQRYQCKSCYGWCNEASVKQNGRINNSQ